MLLLKLNHGEDPFGAIVYNLIEMFKCGWRRQRAGPLLGKYLAIFLPVLLRIRYRLIFCFYHIRAR